MKQRFLSIFTVVALMASVLAGAMGVSLHSVKADSPSENDVLYLPDMKETMLSFASTSVQESEVTSVFALATMYLDTPGYLVTVINIPSEDKYSISVWKHDYSAQDMGFYYMAYNRAGVMEYGLEGALSLGRWYTKVIASAVYNGSSFTALSSTPGTSVDGWYRSSLYNFQNVYNFPTPYEWNTTGFKTYCSPGIGFSRHINTNEEPSMAKNITLIEPEPEQIEFEIIAFTIGERKYLSVLNQRIMVRMDPDLMGYNLVTTGFLNSTSEVISYSYEDVVLLPNGDNYIPGSWSEVSPAGIYAIDITDKNWISIDSVVLSELVDDDFEWVGYATNCPYSLVGTNPGQDGNPDSYTQAFSTFYEYYNNYNLTHFIPENLADTLFGLNGSRLYPCEVSVPVAVWNANTTDGSSFADSHNWKWWFPSRDNYGINFELMDVVIVTEPYNDRYSLLYYYSDSLNVPFQFIQNLTFDELLEEFDCIIIVPDDLNMLDGNVWWKNLLTDICNFLGISDLTSNLLTSLAMSGSDSNGVEYVTERPDEVPGTLQGFCIVTKKAIQRQQLYVFNEGITKTYELMCNYLDERGKWEDSFLEWTLGLFYQWQTLDGKLGDIYNLLYGWNLSSILSDISESLARIAANTSEEDPGYWFLSLFNWLNRFSVTDSDFANWVSEYDDFTDDLPDPGTGATVIPFPTAIPTVAVGG